MPRESKDFTCFTLPLAAAFCNGVFGGCNRLAMVLKKSGTGEVGGVGLFGVRGVVGRGNILFTQINLGAGVSKKVNLDKVVFGHEVERGSTVSAACVHTQFGTYLHL